MSVRYWLKTHLFSRHFWKKIKILCQTRPYDFWGLYKIEQATIRELWETIKDDDIYVGVEYDVRDMKICERLLDIMMDDKVSLFHFNRLNDFECRSDGVVVFNPQYICDVKVNTKNVKRFAKNKVLEEYYVKYPHELYIEKARRLYHKIRYERDTAWAD